jgi:sugar phosphate isomerase/epimerase
MDGIDMSKIVLGVNNGFAIKNWPEPSNWAKIISDELKIKEVQFSFDLLDPRTPEPQRSIFCEEILKETKKREIIIRTTFTGLIIYSQNHLGHPNSWNREQAFQWFKSALELTSKLGAEGAGGYIGGMSISDLHNAARKKVIYSAMLSAVKELTKVASVLGLKYFLWELMPKPGEIPHTPEEALELVEELNTDSNVPVQICFDLGHTSSYDLESAGNPYIWLEKLLPVTSMIHLQQTDGKGDRHWPFTPEFNSKGIIEPKRVVEIVKTSRLEKIDLILELSHPLDVHPQKIIDDYKYSIEKWLECI